MDEKKTSGEAALADSPDAQQTPKVLGQVNGKSLGGPKRYPKPSKKLLVIVSLVVIAGLLIIGGPVGYSSYKTRRHNNELTKLNDSVLEGNTSQALAHAKKALSLEPENVDTILVVANLTQGENPSEAKQLYSRALEAFKKHDNPDVDGKNTVTYWAAAGLAEQAGLNDQAKRYYQKVIDTADLKDSYDDYLAKQSHEALKRLQ